MHRFQNSKKSWFTDASQGWNEGLPAGKLPQISWTSDYYLNWQAVNAKNIQVQTMLTGANFLLNVPNNVYGAALSSLDLASSVASTMQTVKEAQIVPPQAKGNTNSGDVAFASGASNFTFRNMCVRREFAEIIDEYFSMFGYKVNATKVPNIRGRRNWNFVKLHDANISGVIPQADLSEIKSIFNRGITFWHNPNTFMDYTSVNNIV